MVTTICMTAYSIYVSSHARCPNRCVVQVRRLFMFKAAQAAEKSESIVDLTRANVRSLPSNFSFEVRGASC
jgi:hypothetical protein